MTDQDELINLEHAIPELRAELFRLQDHLRLSLKDLGLEASVGELLVSFAEEHGIDHIKERLREEPSALGLASDSKLLSEANMRRVLDLVDQAYTTDQDLSRLVNAREAILSEADPDHVRVRNVGGREAVFDFEKKTLLYTDDKTIEPLQVAIVEPTRQPERMPAPEIGSRDKDYDR